MSIATNMALAKFYEGLYPEYFRKKRSEIMAKFMNGHRWAIMYSTGEALLLGETFGTRPEAETAAAVLLMNSIGSRVFVVKFVAEAKIPAVTFDNLESGQT